MVIDLLAKIIFSYPAGVVQEGAGKLAVVQGAVDAAISHPHYSDSRR